MRILMVASEAAPYAKTGGLADVIGALPAALAAQGETVAVAMPYYRAVEQQLAAIPRVAESVEIWMGAFPRVVHIRQLVERGVTWYFIESPHLYDRGELYNTSSGDYPDNHIRFAVLSHAALAVVRRLFRPDVIHCHDWQAALVAPLARRAFATDPTFFGVKLLFTIHNLGYQGIFPPAILADLGLPPDLFRPDVMEFFGNLNVMKGAIACSDAISTVSPTYAREIQTPELGFGLDGLLRLRSLVLHGILNGVDYGEWSPETDRYIAASYSAADLSGKRACKRDLLAEFGLPHEDLERPLVGLVSRFVPQKGFDLVGEVAERIAAEDLALVALGTGAPEYERLFRELACGHPDKVAVRLGYDNALAHKIEAGADIFLMPSRYEPCGLNQIYSLRYGTVPVVRATGGLDDTIDTETGFKFREYSGTALLETLRAALAAYPDKKRWSEMMQKGMARDHSWSASAREYRALYRQLGG